MHASRLQLFIIAGLLFLAGAGFTFYKAFELGFPLLPGDEEQVWTLESKISFDPASGPVDVSLALPESEAGWVVLDEHFASSGFGFSVQGDNGTRRANWTRRELQERTTLYYKMRTYRANHEQLAPLPPEQVEAPILNERRAAAVSRVAEILQSRSADPRSFTTLLLAEFLNPAPIQDALFLLAEHDDNVLHATQEVLAYAGIAAHRITGVFLEDGRRRQRASSLLEIYDGNQWIPFDPSTGNPGLPENFFIWQRGEQSVLDVVGGRNSRLEFAIVKESLPTKTIVLMEKEDADIALIDFSIYALPVEQQGVFKNILLVPIGALIVVLLRVLIGIKTSGTFMPILIALAFIQTTLVTGLTIFLLVVGVGLWIRSYLSHLNLLLVARVSAVVVVVVVLMAALSVFSYKLGINQALTVTFFPTIILAWTIERMSVLWEEEGAHEVLLQGGGSLLVAVAAYLVMTNRFVEHLTFNFPELMLCLVAIILLMGQYTGYRLSELYRFRYLRSKE